MKRKSVLGALQIVLLAADLLLLAWIGVSFAKRAKPPATVETTAPPAATREATEPTASEPTATEPDATDETDAEAVSTAAPTTAAPTTAAPTTAAPATAAPTTAAPTTAAPTTAARSEADTLLAGFSWFANGSGGPPADAVRLTTPDGAEGEWLCYIVPKTDPTADRRLERITIAIGQYGMQVTERSYKRIGADGSVRDDPNGNYGEHLCDWSDGGLGIYGSEELTITGFYRTGGRRIATGTLVDYFGDRWAVAMIEA